MLGKDKVIRKMQKNGFELINNKNNSQKLRFQCKNICNKAGRIIIPSFVCVIDLKDDSFYFVNDSNYLTHVVITSDKCLFNNNLLFKIELSCFQSILENLNKNNNCYDSNYINAEEEVEVC